MDTTPIEQRRDVGRLLLSGVVGSLPLIYRFATHEPMHWEELSHYLGAMQRALDGQIVVKDFNFLFGPTLLWTLRRWMEVFGVGLASVTWFFMAGWSLFLVLLGIVVAQCSRSIVIAALMCLIFSTFWMSTSFDILASWGGPRYVPGVLVLALGNEIIRRQHSTSAAFRLSFFGGVLLPLAGSLSPEQVTIALAAHVGGWLLLRRRAISATTADVQTRSRCALSCASGLMLGTGLLLMAVPAGSLVQHLRELPAYASWRQPLSEYAKDRVLFAVAMFLPAMTVYLMGLRRRGLRLTSGEDLVLIFGLFCAAQFVYALRAFQHSQGLMATGYLLLFAGCLLQRTWATSALRPIVSIIAAAYLAITVVVRAEAGRDALDRIVSNFSGVPVRCATGCRESSASRLRGVWLPLADANALDAVLVGVRAEWRTTTDSTYFVYPEDGFLEFALAHSAVGRFPVAALANTKPEWRSQLLSVLAAAPPHIVVRRRTIGLFARSVGSKTELLPEIAAFVASNYIVFARGGQFEVLRHSSPR